MAHIINLADFRDNTPRQVAWVKALHARAAEFLEKQDNTSWLALLEQIGRDV